jgi:hypothetical protein
MARAIMEANTFAEFAEQYPLVASDPAAERFYESHRALSVSTNRLFAHAKRTSHRQLTRFMESVKSLITRVKTQCSEQLWDSLHRQARYCTEFYDDLQSGQYMDSVAGVVSERLEEDLAASAQDLVKQIGKINPNLDQDHTDLTQELEDNHDSFVKALEKSLKVEAHHWEPVREGLIVFFDEENTNELLDQLRSYNDILQKITDEHGYILLRRGTMEDVASGGFPRSMSHWYFIYCPRDLESWLEPEAMEKLGKDHEKTAADLDKKLIADIKKLPLTTPSGKSILKVAKTL